MLYQMAENWQTQHLISEYFFSYLNLFILLVSLYGSFSKLKTLQVAQFFANCDTVCWHYILCKSEQVCGGSFAQKEGNLDGIPCVVLHGAVGEAYRFGLMNRLSISQKTSSVFGCLTEKATDGSLQSEDWTLNMEICDIINETEEG